MQIKSFDHINALKIDPVAGSARGQRGNQKIYFINTFTSAGNLLQCSGGSVKMIFFWFWLYRVLSNLRIPTNPNHKSFVSASPLDKCCWVVDITEVNADKGPFRVRGGGWRFHLCPNLNKLRPLNPISLIHTHATIFCHLGGSQSRVDLLGRKIMTLSFRVLWILCIYPFKLQRLSSLQKRLLGL